MEAWRNAWRNGIVPLLSIEALQALKTALENDDSRLIQGATTTPPPFTCVQDWPCEAACPVGFCGWQGEEGKSVGDVEEYFAKTCFEADRLLNEPAACRWFLNWFDEFPRSEVLKELLEEVNQNILKKNLDHLSDYDQPIIIG